MRSTIKLDRWSPPLTRQRSLADVGPATGSVWIVRHGERVDVVNPDWLVTAERPHDPPLTEFGCAQAAATGEYLLGLGDRVDFVYTSPFLRCVQTASAIARGLGGVPLRVEPGLCEWLNSDWFEANDNPMDAEMGTSKLKHVADTLGVRIDTSYRPLFDSAGRAVASRASKATAGEPSYQREVAFPESSDEAIGRYTTTLAHLRELTPHAVLVTHGYGVWRMSEWLVAREITEDCGYCSATRVRRFRNLRGEEPWRCDVLAYDAHLDTLEQTGVVAPLGVRAKG